MNQREADAASRFSCSVRERCVFELGIKLATIYHQFVGTPFDSESIGSLEHAISEAIEVQPYVVSAEVRIDRSRLDPDRDTYGYVSLTGDMIDARVRVTIDDVTAVGEMRYDEELGYPLMYVSELSEKL